MSSGLGLRLAVHLVLSFRAERGISGIIDEIEILRFAQDDDMRMNLSRYV